jgi:hypothetical protein
MGPDSGVWRTHCCFAPVAVLVVVVQLMLVQPSSLLPWLLRLSLLSLLSLLPGVENSSHRRVGCLFCAGPRTAATAAGIVVIVRRPCC